MDEVKDWEWLIKTNKGDFYVTVVGKWTQEEAAKNVRIVFEILKLDIVGMIPRKRASGPDDMMCTIYETEKPIPPFGFEFLAGKKLWEVCGRGVEYEAQLILLKKES